MARALSDLFGTVAMVLSTLLWLSLLHAGWADHFVDKLFGLQNEYRVVLGAALLAVILAFLAAMRGARWWFIGLAYSVATLGFFTYALSR